LALQPGNEAATQGLKQLDEVEALETLYKEGVAAQEAGDFQLALENYNTILQRSSGYKDVVKRIREIRQRADEDVLFARAEESFKGSRCTEAIDSYRQLQALNATYKRDAVTGRLFDCYISLGREIVERQPPATDRLPQAKDYFVKALALRPRETDAAAEERLITVYLAGQAAVEGRNWEDAARWFEAVHKQRPGYLSNIYLRPLYDAYIANGDAYAAAERYADAWDQYDKAVGLPVENSVVAIERRARIAFKITPTPTPTVTPTVTPLPTPTAIVFVTPTALPSPTPVPPLASFRNQIVFRADKEGQYGYWVMNPDGSNRRYLGNSKELDSQYEALIVKEQLSPDGRCRLYPYKEKGETYVQIYIRCQGNQEGELWSRKLTFLEGITYDAVWAPDGSRIAFVSAEKTSDDVYVIDPDGKSWWNYTLNTWEWDKHPSFSPDSRKIVFWSNREGTKQLYVIDADGRNAKKIYATTWDEYDPIWVK
jgi:TolB protein